MTIDFDVFSEKSIDDAISKVEEYRKNFQEKTSELVKQTAEVVRQNAANELANHIWTGQTLASLHTEMRSGSYTANVLVGGAAVWLEFGTGVVTNGSYVGGYVHPMGAELGMCGLGTYGQGHGAEPNYHGIPATLFMWNSAQIARQNVTNIARRVFR